jgi:TPR repeat protein
VILSLVAEPVFSNAFGKSYREQTQSDFRSTVTTLTECRRNGSLTPVEVQLTQQVWSEHMQQSLLRQMEALQAQRAELASVQLEIEALRPVEEDYDRLDALKAKGEAIIRQARPESRNDPGRGGNVLSDLARFETYVDATRTRIGAPVETQRIQTAIASAEGSAGLQTLSGHLDRLRRSQLPASVLQPLRTNLHERIGALAGVAAQQERRLITPPRGDLDDLATHATAVREFENRNERVLSLAPPLQELGRELRSERQGLLPGASTEVARQVRAIRNPDQIDQVVSRYFLTEELQSGSGAELKRFADQRSSLLKRISTDVAMFGEQPEHSELLAGTVSAAIQATRCDQMAADPADAGRIAPGVPDDEMDAAGAVQACLEAVKGAPRSGRLQFQLGRALLEDGKVQEALAQLRRAIDLQYPAAYHYLGEAYLEGVKGVLPKNDKLAAQYAKVAQKGGYGSGMTGSDPGFADKDYEDAKTMQAVYFGNSSLLSENGLYNFNYLVYQARMLAQECRSFKLTEIGAYQAALARAVIPGTTEGMTRMGMEHIKNIFVSLAEVVRNPRSMVDSGMARQKIESAGLYGTRDLGQMWSTVGANCQAPQIKRYTKNLRHYLARVGA